jgi:asparagine synthase (glutamine-hydrolysing)
MCGICGKIDLDGSRSVKRELLQKMRHALRHRGPDDGGEYISGRVGLGHTRLSIIDLNTGKQPITNEDSTIWVVFNGEIYNYKELKAALVKKGHVFKTETDTEVIVHLYEENGEDFLTALRGMFAIALWDERRQTLILARDRVGIKPLYYYFDGRSLVFASEIKAILEDPEVPKSLNATEIPAFLAHYYMPGSQTLLKNIFKLLPGHYLKIKDGKKIIKQYWDLEFKEPAKRENLNSYIEQLNGLLNETVRDHMISDVPVGVLLSGGVDSTAILSLAVHKTNKAISTFTIGFEGQNFADERYYARLAANQFGTRHHETTITAKDFESFIPQYVWHMEEPVCEPPAIALYYVSKMAKQKVKVLLSGEGGDEAFAGYHVYRNLVWLERLKKIAGPFNGCLAGILWRLNSLMKFKKLGKHIPLLKLSLPKYYYSLTANPFSFFNAEHKNLFTGEFQNEITNLEFSGQSSKYFNNVSSLHLLNKLLYVDTKTWLPDDLLIKADKMTMANSLELRVPFLDHKVLEFAASLPWDYKLNGFNTKFILKKAFSNRIPKGILNRKKAGLPVPYESWLRNELSHFVHDILLDRTTLQRGYFNRGVIEDLLKKNKANNLYATEIFSLLVLELWHRIFLKF